MATSIGDPGEIWIHDLEWENVTRFTFDSGSDTSPIWSPDGERVLFNSSRLIPGQRFTPSNLFVKPASGQRVAQHVEVGDYSPALAPSDWSPDGRMAVPVESGETFRHDTPVALFELPEVIREDWVDQTYDAALDGQRFLFLVPREDTAPGKGTVTLVQGWRGLVE